MRLVKRPLLLLTLCSALALGSLTLGACGGGDDDDGATGGPDAGGGGTGTDAGGGGTGTVDPAGENHTYVISDVRVPQNAAEATMFGLNIDGDTSNGGCWGCCRRCSASICRER